MSVTSVSVSAVSRLDVRGRRMRTVENSKIRARQSTENEHGYNLSQFKCSQLSTVRRTSGRPKSGSHQPDLPRIAGRRHAAGRLRKAHTQGRRAADRGDPRAHPLSGRPRRVKEEARSGPPRVRHLWRGLCPVQLTSSRARPRPGPECRDKTHKWDQEAESSGRAPRARPRRCEN